MKSSTSVAFGVPVGFGLFASAASAEENLFSPDRYISFSSSRTTNIGQELFSADPAQKIGDLSPSTPGDRGKDFRLEYGTAPNPNWDLRLRFSSIGLSEMEQSVAEFVPANPPAPENNLLSSARTDLDMLFFDIERVGEVPFRSGQLSYFVGMRALKYHSEIQYSHQDKVGNFTNQFQEEGLALGPRAGLEHHMALGTTGLNLNTELAASLLYRRSNTTFLQNTNGPISYTENDDEGFVFNPSLSIAVQGMITDTSFWEIGYRVEGFSNLAPSHLNASQTGAHNAGRSDIINHGVWFGVTFMFQ